MKVQILQENLEKAINVASRFASSKAQLPILGNLLLNAKNNKLYVSSTNLEISSCIQLGAKVEEEGEISIPSKIIFELVSNLPKETVNLETDKEQLKVTTGSFTSTLLGINSTDFPKVPEYLDEKRSLKFIKKEIVDALGKVSFATSTDETRPILTGVLFILDEGSLSLVATDGFRLSRKIILTKETKTEKKSFVIPKGVLNEIGRGVFISEDILIELNEKEKQVVFGLEDTVLTSRLIEGEYPDFEKIIPKESSLKILLDKEELLRAVKLASVFAREASNVIKIKIFKDSIKILAESGTAGSQETKVDSKVEGNYEKFEIAFNYHFFEDFIHSVEGEEISIEFMNSNAAGVFKDTSDSKYLHLIMPVKI